MAFDIDINSLSEKTREFIEALKINDFEKYNKLNDKDVLWLEGQLNSIFSAQATTTTTTTTSTTTTTTAVPGFNGSSGVVSFSGGCASPGNYVVTATSSKAGYVAGITAYDTSGNVLIAEVASGSTIAMAATTNYVFRVRDTGGNGSNGSDLNFTIVPV